MSSRQGIAIAVAGFAAAALVPGASSESAASKQRVAIEGRLHLATGKGTWTLLPLGPGPLKRDSGTVVGGGDIKPPLIKSNGQRVVVVVGKDVMTGRSGTFIVTQRVETVDLGRGWSIGYGTFSFKGSTGAYRGITGSGGFSAAASPPGTVLYSRQEGYVVKR